MHLVVPANVSRIADRQEVSWPTNELHTKPFNNLALVIVIVHLYSAGDLVIMQNFL